MSEEEKKIWELLSILYSGEGKCTYSQAEIDLLNDVFKKYERRNGIEGLRAEKLISALISREPVVLAELEDAIDGDRALMSGALSECNLSSTIANKMGLDSRIIIKGKSASIPRQLTMVMDGFGIEKCRYIYYKDGDFNTVLFQCGAPDSCDAFLIYDGLKINVEYKERMAKAGEYDLDHDENGKLIVPEKVKISHPEVVAMVDAFNRNTNLFDEIGHNYNLFDTLTRVRSIIGYFKSKEIDLLVSIDKTDALVAIISNWIDLNLDEKPGAFHIIETDGSEIRTTGRNPANIICPNHFRKVFTGAGGVISSKGDCAIRSGNKVLRIAKGRGTGRPSKLKIKSIYEVPLNNKGYGVAVLNRGMWLFGIKSVRQKRPTVSPHMTIVATRDEIKDYFGF